MPHRNDLTLVRVGSKVSFLIRNGHKPRGLFSSEIPNRPFVGATGPRGNIDDLMVEGVEPTGAHGAWGECGTYPNRWFLVV